MIPPIFASYLPPIFTKISIKILILSQSLRMWEFIRFITSLSNDYNWFILRFWDRLYSKNRVITKAVISIKVRSYVIEKRLRKRNNWLIFLKKSSIYVKNIIIINNSAFKIVANKPSSGNSFLVVNKMFWVLQRYDNQAIIYFTY